MIRSGRKPRTIGVTSSCECEQIAGIGGRGWERHVHRASERAGSTGRAEGARVGGVPVLLVQGDREDIVAVPEDALGTVSHVNVPVMIATVQRAGAGVLDRARHVVEIRRGDPRSARHGARPGELDQRTLEAASRTASTAASTPPTVSGPLPVPGVTGRLAVPGPARAGETETAKVRRRVDREQRLVGRRERRDAREPAAQRAALHKVVRLRGQYGLGDVRAAQGEGAARDLHSRGRRIMGEDTGCVRVAHHDAARPKRRVRAWSRGVAASIPAAGSGRCSRSGSAGGSPGAPARRPRTGRPR